MNTHKLETETSNSSAILEELEQLAAEHRDLITRTRQAKAKLYASKGDLPEDFKKLKKQAQASLLKNRYNTKNGLTIHSLRQAGLVVTVSHIRYTEMADISVLIPVPSYLRKAFNFTANGGSTHITILKQNGEWLCLSSICHIDDAFCYKMGVKKALEQLTQEEADDLLSHSDATEEVVVEEQVAVTQ